MSFKDSWNNYWNKAFSSWDNYHKYGIIPNIWAGITGQKSQEIQTEANIASSNEQFDKNLDFQTQQYQDELAFQREQFQGQMNIANQNLALNRNIADKNYNLQQQAFEYQKQLNSTQMEREDSALQRQIADAQAAGLSPLSVLGGSGSTSTPLTSGSAPQMDLSGVNGSVGQYLDIARQYASLHAQATQNYMNGRNQAAVQHNSQVLGARTALAQMKADMHYKGQSMATQYFNAAVNAKNARLNRDWIQEQIESSRAERNWMHDNGYRNRSFENAVVEIATHLLKNNSTSAVIDKVEDILNVSKSKASEIVDKAINGSPEPNKPNTVPKPKFNAFTQVNLKSLAKKWSYNKAEYTYLNSMTLRKNYNFDAWINYYSKNIPENWYK